MKWNKIHDFLTNLIAQKPSVHEGYSMIKELLNENNLTLVELDINKMYKHFFWWVNNVLQDNPIPSNIKGIYFGLRNMKFGNDKGNQYKTTILQL